MVVEVETRIIQNNSCIDHYYKYNDQHRKQKKAESRSRMTSIIRSYINGDSEGNSTDAIDWHSDDDDRGGRKRRKTSATEHSKQELKVSDYPGTYLYTLI